MNDKKRESFWLKLTGSPETHALEARIFHVTCVITILLFSCSIFFNYFIGLYTLSLLLIPAVAAAGVVYYISRYRYLLNLGITIFCVLGNILFIAFFLNNSGVNGPALVIYLLFFFLVMSIVPVNQRLIWMGINVSVAFALIVYQYQRPLAVPLNYKNDLNKYLDAGYVYFFTIVIVYFIITSIINNYNKERLLAEERAAELEKLNQSKNKLFSILAHDLKSPLNSIQNFLEISLVVEIEEHEKRTINSSLLRETKYTGQLLSNLLTWSKTQMEGLKVKLITLDPKKALEHTILLQSSLAEEKSILLNNLIGENIQVVADNDMLELVIRNLISNAIKFTPAGGEIVISSEVRGHECWISVQDTGVGIDKINFHNIFSMRSESTYGTNQEKGVGLGLVLCKEFISAQNGRIWVESTLGEGTTFFVSLELAAHAELFPVHLN